MTQVPMYVMELGFMVVNKVSGECMTQFVFTQSIKYGQIVLVQDGTGVGLIPALSKDFSEKYKIVDFQEGR